LHHEFTANEDAGDEDRAHVVGKRRKPVVERPPVARSRGVKLNLNFKTHHYNEYLAYLLRFDGQTLGCFNTVNYFRNSFILVFMWLIRRWLLGSYLFLKLQSAQSQDPSFSQIENSRLYTHSSDLVYRCGLQAEAIYRNQWSNIPGGFTTVFAGAVYQSEKMKSGFGFKYLSDTEGSIGFRTTDFKGIYRYSIIQPQNTLYESLVASLEFGRIIKNIDWSQLVFSNQLDPVFGVVAGGPNLGIDTKPVSFWDFATSVTYRSKLKLFEINRPYTLSLSWRHMGVGQLSNKEESLTRTGEKLPGIITLTASMSFTPVQFYRMPLFKPIIRYEHQRNLKRIILGSMMGVTYEDVTSKESSTWYLGAYYSSQYNPLNIFNTNGLIFQIGVEKGAQSKFSIAYSYDLNSGGLGNASSGGTHEVTFNYFLSKCSSKDFRGPSSVFESCPN